MIVIRDADAFGPALAGLRGMFGLTQRGLVDETDGAFSQSQIADWESNRFRPGLPSLIRIVNALGYDLALVPRRRS
ncbi:helix-turn-helix domain-containing protein [Actinoplanes palleronii]|uniref:HTH cro/C1-type domain-containing protein n=1 Tax=Actinoplanes palleronii TaxID=113570 RepID=A0ABQ4BJB0_9ACTN|nr:helix-turn-helix transcriptional regulator [Actinoplanes palleronii]GIE70754.1 hypothetical protein Apa02nite_068620 [Actinoplanes palleronii]